ncbi:MAG TPA: hypothetical protein VEH06_07220 [Candidatus Bathyarchaeia archaeon]|nr:hypothetical protein [Candidatus Bathyarchaeia archaeon]
MNTKEWKRTAAIEGLIATGYVDNILVTILVEQFFSIKVWSYQHCIIFLIIRG